jgi:hypothetical protein
LFCAGTIAPMERYSHISRQGNKNDFRQIRFI